MNALRQGLLRAACVAALLYAAAFNPAAAQVGDVCSAASPYNPAASPAGAGGMGGTGTTAGAGGMGGTGTVADVVPGSGGMGGTGSPR